MTWLRVVIAGILTLGGLQARPASAWNQAHVKSGCGERWLSEAIDIKVHLLDGGVHGLSTVDYLGAVTASLDRWQAVSCELCPGAGPNQPPVPCAKKPLGVVFTGRDYGNATGLGPGCVDYDTAGVCKGWTPNGNFIVAMHSAWPFGKNVVSITVVTANTATGEIVDADIGLDDSKAAEGKQSFCVGTCKDLQIDLCSALTHELGHLLGMNHSDVATATMYAAATAKETSKCSLAEDDVAGICSMYASTCDPATLGKTADAGGDTTATPPPVDGGSTCSAGRTASGSAWLLLMAAAWMLRRRRI